MHNRRNCAEFYTHPQDQQAAGGRSALAFADDCVERVGLNGW